MKKDTINIYDIAEMAGVSIATVSRVVNGSDKVSEKTRKKVMEVIEREGFTPNVFAQGLGLHTMHTVGIMVPDISDLYMSAAVAWLEESLSGHGYDCILGCSGFEQDGKRRHTEMLLSKHVDALIFVGSTYAGSGKKADETDYIRNAAKQVPVFIINGYVKGDNVYSSVNGDEAAVYRVTKALLLKGRRKPVFITDSGSYSAIQKKSGFEKAIAGSGIGLKDQMELHVENSIYSVRDALLGAGWDFDAVVATNDIIAIGAIKYANAVNKRIPEDIEIVGYNNSNIVRACEPELSSIDNRTEQVCRDTVDRMIKVLENGGGDNGKVEVSCRFVERSTTRISMFAEEEEK